MNKASVTAICHRVSLKTGLPFNTVLVYYFLESVLARFASSELGKHFVFKGGFLLSNIIGVGTRTTADIDFILRDVEFSEHQVFNMLQAVIEDNSADAIHYQITGIDPIREETRYGGFRVRIECRLENMRQIVSLDIATGDFITPHPIEYSYASLFSNKSYQVTAYPIETILAEKIQTIFARGMFNSRSKDFYDLCILYKLRRNDLDYRLVNYACEQTFSNRNTEFDVQKIIELLETLSKDEVFRLRWGTFTSKNSYAKGMNFEEMIGNATDLLHEISLRAQQ